jgi:ABC-type oligopeptide transport system substrate-binding subunit
MSRTSKHFAVFLFAALAVASLTTMQVTAAQAIPKPSVPEFTSKYVDHSYDIPPTYGIDQYTGKTVETKQGEHIDNRTVEITIKNEPFT